jgi:TP901 family phage tail tape measure protein
MATRIEQLKLDFTADTSQAVKGITRLINGVETLDAQGQRLGGTFQAMTRKGIKEFTWEMNSAGQAVVKNTKHIRDFNSTLLGTGDSLGNILAKVAQWTIATGVIFGTMRAFRSMVGTITDVDDQMVMLRKVFQGTEAELNVVKASAIDTSIALGNLVAPSIEATTVWARMGREGRELSEALRVSLLAQNIAEIESADAAKLLNAALIQFNKSVDQGIDVLDKWNELSNRTPVTTRDLADAVSQAGAVFNVAGASIEDLNAYTVALSASMAKTGKEIGNALKTIGSYIKRAETVPKLAKITGIEVERVGEAHLNLDGILLRLASTWGNLTDVEKEEIAQTSAGVRRKAYFLSLMENFNLVLEAYAIQWDAAGSAVKENEIRLDSLRTKFTQLRASLQKFAVQSGDRGLLGVLKGITDAARSNIEVFNELSGAQQGAVLSTAILVGGLTGAINRKIALARVAQEATLATLALGKAMRFTGVVAALGLTALAISTFVDWLGREERAYNDLKKARQDRVSGLQAERQELEALVQQKQLIQDLITTRKELLEQGESTGKIDSFIEQALEGVIGANPDLLKGVDNIEDAMRLIEGASIGAADELERVKKNLFEVSQEMRASEAFRQYGEAAFIKTTPIVTTDRGTDPFGGDIYSMTGGEKINLADELTFSTAKMEGGLDEAWDTIMSYFRKSGVETTRETLSAIAGDPSLLSAFSDSMVSAWTSLPQENRSALMSLIKELTKIEGEAPDLTGMMESLDPDGVDVNRWKEIQDAIKETYRSADRLAESISNSRTEAMTFSEYVKTINSFNLSMGMTGVASNAGQLQVIDTEIARSEKMIAQYRKNIDAINDMKDKSDSALNTQSLFLNLLNQQIVLLDQLSVAREKLTDEIDKDEQRKQREIENWQRLNNQYAKALEGITAYAERMGIEVDPENLEASVQALQESIESRLALGKLTDDQAKRLQNLLYVYTQINKQLDAEEAKQKRVADQIRKQNEALMGRIGQDIGSFVSAGLVDGFNSDDAKSAGRSLANTVGDAIGTKLGASIGASVGGPLGAIVGGGIGALASGLVSQFGEMIFGEAEPEEELAEEVKRNTLAIEANTKAFQDFQERVINAPSTFALPAIKGDIPQYDTGGTVERSGFAYVDEGEFIGRYNQLYDYFTSQGVMGGGPSINIEAGAISVNGAGDPKVVAGEIMDQIDKRYAQNHRRGANISQEFTNV